MSKPDTRLYETLASIARGRPLHKIEALCENQKTVACSVLARMVEEAQDINTDYALTIRYSHEAARAADKARIAAIESDRRKCWEEFKIQGRTMDRASREHAEERDQLLGLLRDIKAWDVDQFLSIPLEIRQRIQAKLGVDQ